MKQLVRKLLAKLNKMHFEFVVKRILETPPLKKGGNDFIALSMVQPSDVNSYLVAIKSFNRWLNPARIVVICDTRMTKKDRDILLTHIPHVELRMADEFKHPMLPMGGTWERLTAITHYAVDSYVVQIDADTITLANLPEVAEAIQQHTAFVLPGDFPSQGVMSMEETRTNAINLGGKHIQTLAEETLALIGPENRRYVRGCSGFTGFPPGLNRLETMLDFSRRMSERLGDRWNEWGTEQVTSNYLAANTERLVLLPYPKYSTPDGQWNQAAFLHFIGYVRFKSTLYASLTDHEIKSLH